MEEIEKIKEIIEDVRDRGADIDEGTIADHLLKLTAYLWKLGDTTSRLEKLAYKVKADLIKASDKMSDAKAETYMRASNEWLDYRISRRQYDITAEMIKSLKFVGRVSEDEKHNSNIGT